MVNTVLYNKKLFTNWLFIGVVMLIVQVSLGSITRLTGSGLSITKWELITGTIPPLTENDWQNAFSQYQNTPQYLYLNYDFNINDFKTIYFWEWMHRFWARLMALVFVIGILFFYFKKALPKYILSSFVLLFFLGLIQGAIGWIMVKSGLTGTAVYVQPLKLAIHFVLAIILTIYLWDIALKVKNYNNQSNTILVSSKILKKIIISLILLTLIQFFLGAMLAGAKAAQTAPTWPTINGSWIPNNLFTMSEENWVLKIHFFHRLNAYLIFLITCWYVFKSSLVLKTKNMKLLYIVLIQVGLGISTLFSSKNIIPQKWGIFESVALLHQIIGIIFLMELWRELFYKKLSYA